MAALFGMEGALRTDGSLAQALDDIGSGEVSQSGAALTAHHGPRVSHSDPSMLVEREVASASSPLQPG
jgi:hypothetical protein